MISRCPHCNSVYEISDAQLDQALGAVRCSNCMKIFNALNHRVDNSQAYQKISKSKDFINSTNTNLYKDLDFKPERRIEPSLEQGVDFDLARDRESLPNSQSGQSLQNSQSSKNYRNSHQAQADADIRKNSNTSFKFADKLKSAKNIKTARNSIRKSKTSDNSNLISDKNSYNLHQKSRTNNVQEHKRHSLFEKVKQKLPIIYFAIGSFIILLLALFAFRFFSASQAQNSGFAIKDVVLLPADSLQEFKVEFSVENLSNRSADLPKLKFELQDLSKNIIETQVLDFSNLDGDKSILLGKQKRKMSATLIRPKKLVAGVEISLLDEGQNSSTVKKD